jgi:hypothetical protein
MLSPEAIAYYIDHLPEFVHDILRATPTDYQGDILRQVASRQRTAIKSGHGTGKSSMESWAILWFLATRPFPKIPCTAPTQHQLSDILWAELSKWKRQSLLDSCFTWTAQKLYFNPHPEEWFAVARTASTNEALQGFHADHLLFIIDEASGIDDEIFQPVAGALSGNDNKLFMCGNPTQLYGFFFDAFNKDVALYATATLNSEESPLVSPEFCLFIASKWGRDSDVYRVRVLGLFPKAIPDSLIPMDWIEAAMRKEIVIPEEPKVIRIGVDIARFGNDSTVLATRIDDKILPLEQHRKEGETQTAGHVLYQARKLHERYPDLTIDAITDDGGLGGGVTDILVEQVSEQHLSYLNVIPLNFGGSPQDKKEYADKSAEIWSHLRELLQYQQMELPEDAELLSQLGNRKYSVNSKGRVVLEPKELMKKRGLASPDKADAVVLAMCADDNAWLEFLRAEAERIKREKD